MIRVMLTLEEGTALVRVAQATIKSLVSGMKAELESASYPRLRQPRGAFVSILDHSRRRILRGCIGNPFPDKTVAPPDGSVSLGGCHHGPAL